MSPIRYYDFWDVPRAFIAADAVGTYLLDGRFDEQLDDFPDFYEVFAMPPLAEQALACSWVDLLSRALSPLGRVRVRDVRFDPSRRKQVDLDSLRQLLRQ
ncbi:MAG: hypothetical protein V4710_22790 [Verrucomicrobiota bacterium]